jgi:hypothetical protein
MDPGRSGRLPARPRSKSLLFCFTLAMSSPGIPRCADVGAAVNFPAFSKSLSQHSDFTGPISRTRIHPARTNNARVHTEADLAKIAASIAKWVGRCRSWLTSRVLEPRAETS